MDSKFWRKKGAQDHPSDVILRTEFAGYKLTGMRNIFDMRTYTLLTFWLKSTKLETSSGIPLKCFGNIELVVSL